MSTSVTKETLGAELRFDVRQTAGTQLPLLNKSISLKALRVPTCLYADQEELDFSITLQTEARSQYLVVFTSPD